ncbi:MAG TPA: hypothetical protein VEX18_07760 [Polyangiaceae bacterium]|nr:hypothetical protein [Polyangiaceae bacterium]
MLRALRGTLVLGFAGVVASNAAGCFILRCDETFHGIERGEELTTTIVGPYSDITGGTGCGELGDLPAGTTLTWTAQPDGPGDGCDNHLDMKVSSVSTGTVSDNVITLPSGCTGTWLLSAHAIGDDASFLENDSEDPSWYIMRNFQQGSSECFSDGAPSTSCVDYFVATSTR